MQSTDYVHNRRMINIYKNSIFLNEEKLTMEEILFLMHEEYILKIIPVEMKPRCSTTATMKVVGIVVFILMKAI